MKASVIIPTYKRPECLSDALSSVIAQDFSKDDYEIVIVDNGAQATPELAVLCDPAARPSVCYIHEASNGLHHARHAGAKLARGEILVYIDDDVLCPPGWLTAMMTPYQDQQVAMVAGKVVLHFEETPPAWLPPFHGLLSALDWGDTARAVSPYGTPVGCNMSVRKKVLFEVGGFNPDGFGDRSLIHLRGDGECGLAHKIHEAGYLVWYAPEAMLEHRVPSTRMTPQYVEWRSAIGGIEDAYTALRYSGGTLPGLLLRSVHSVAYYFYHRGCTLCPRGMQAHMLHRAAAMRYKYRMIQTLRQAASGTLREHTARSSSL